MTDPSDADLASLDPWKERVGAQSRALGKERWDQNFRKKVALMPVKTGFQADAPGG